MNAPLAIDLRDAATFPTRRVEAQRLEPPEELATVATAQVTKP